MIKHLVVCLCFGVSMGLPFLMQAHSIEAQELDALTRVPWTESRIKGTPDPPSPYRIERVYDSLKFNRPTEMLRVPKTNRWLVVQQNGTIITFSKDQPDDVQPAIVMTDAIESAFRPHGFAFHPKFPEQPYCYIAFSSKKKDPNGTQLCRFMVTDPDVLKIDPKSGTTLATWSSVDHFGGSPQFGPDGYLYWSIGDGQYPNPPDPKGTGQDISDLQASILRIDVDHQDEGLPYRIPPDNPFVKVPGARGEVWAFGVRNPWKIAFHPTTGDLWAADVGWEMREMIYRIERGANYGWSVVEGSQNVKVDGKRSSIPISKPLFEYDHVAGRSITGGYFWQSDRIPDLKGAYIYGDWMTGKIWGLKHDGENVTWQDELTDTPLQIVSFANDDDGDVLVVGYDGTMWKIVPNPAAQQQSSINTFPRLLSETGLFADTAKQTPTPGVIPYSINANHWSDHSTSEQWFGLTGDSQLSLFDRSNWEVGQVEGFFAFPHDGVVAKTVSYRTVADDPNSSRRLETQILHRHEDEWNAYNYIWNEDQLDAVLQDNIPKYSQLEVLDSDYPGGVRKQTWLHASRDQCKLCHIWSAGTVHGFKVDQINRGHGDENVGQLEKFQRLGLFDSSILGSQLAKAGPAVSCWDESASLEDRARMYLDLHCAHCHRRGGGGSAPFQLSRNESLEETNMASPATQGTFGVDNAQVIAPGDPGKSVLLYRLAKHGPGRMPQFGNSIIDEAGVQLIHNWIAGMDSQGNESQFQPVQLQIDQLFASTEDASSFQRTLDKLLSKTESAIQLSVRCGAESDSLKRKITDYVIANSKPEVRDLFERFLPDGLRAKRLGDNFSSAELLAITGDREEGRKLYFGESLTCKNCHLIGGEGKSVGPALDDIGLKRKPAEILASLIDPSAIVEDSFRGVVLLTSDGTLLTGLLGERIEGNLVLIDVEGKSHQVPEEDIEEMRTLEKSLMPERLLNELTAQQATDLMAFLQSLNTPSEK